MPLQDIDTTQMGAMTESYPWERLADIEGVPLAIVQAWGYLPDKDDAKFQVCLLAMLLEDAFKANGEPVASVFAFSFDAPDQNNPRRDWLTHFADPRANPIGPVNVVRVEASNQQGWVWAIRRSPLPAGADTSGIAVPPGLARVGTAGLPGDQGAGVPARRG